MSFSLYDATAASFLQILAALEAVLEKGRHFCEENGLDPNDMVETRLCGDMLPFRFQIASAVGHSIGAIEGVKAGLFTPPDAPEEIDYAGLQTLAVQALARLRALEPADVNALAERDLVFRLGEREMPFVGAAFLLSFSVPNFYFHATTAYDILRMKGVPLGKRDFLGRPRMKV